MMILLHYQEGPPKTIYFPDVMVKDSFLARPMSELLSMEITTDNGTHLQLLPVSDVNLENTV